MSNDDLRRNPPRTVRSPQIVYNEPDSDDINNDGVGSSDEEGGGNSGGDGGGGSDRSTDDSLQSFSPSEKER